MLNFYIVTNNIWKQCIQKSRFLITIADYDSGAPLSEDATLTPITSSISSSIRLSSHVQMDNLTSSASRNYYQRIVNDQRTTYDQKKLQIYMDLVVGSKSHLNLSLVQFKGTIL